MAKKIYTSTYTGAEVQDILERANDKPIVVWHDKAEKLYRFFSKESNYELWQKDKNTYADLELFNIIAPNEYELDINGLDIDNKYYILGSENNYIDFTFITTQDGKVIQEAVTCTYTFTNNGISQSQTEIYAYGTNVHFNIDKFLKEGTTEISIILRGRTTYAIKYVSLTINVINFNVSITTPVNHYFYNTTSNGTATQSFRLTFDVYSPYDSSLYVFTEQPLTSLANAVANISVNSSTSTQDISIDIPKNNLLKTDEENKTNIKLPHDVYPLWIFAEIKNINSTNQTFQSNIIYYEMMIIDDKNQTSRKHLSAITCAVDSYESIGRYPSFRAEIYRKIKIEYGVFSSNSSNNAIQVRWYLKNNTNGSIEVFNKTLNDEQVRDDINNKSNLTLEFSHDEAGIYDLYSHIGTNAVSDISYVTEIFRTNNSITKTTDELVLELTGYGKTNDDRDKDRWTYSGDAGTITTTFKDFAWTTMCGWNENGLCVANGAQATINYAPFGLQESVINNNGLTIEIDFETYDSDDDNAELLTIYNGGRGIIIESTQAKFGTSSSSCTTRFKTNERITLTFVINQQSNTKQSRLLKIINNGVLERAANYENLSNLNTNIIIGNEEGLASIKIYAIRVYNKALNDNQILNNYLINLSNPDEKINNNDISTSYNSGTYRYALDVDKISSKLDTIYIDGWDPNFLDGSQTEKVEVRGATIKRESPFDPERNFTIKNAVIRAHGQSTLSQPVKSLKIWSDKDENAQMTDYMDEIIDSGRYQMKSDSIPIKKWVLQANYQDSSCCHNGSLLRLINDVWFNTELNGEYPLRTEPQKVAANWQNLSFNNIKEPFPYQPLRIGADSFPCVVFKRNAGMSEDTPWEFVGQYVFMEDKKANHVFGERSLYSCVNDPFLFNHKKADYTRVWNNEYTFRWEILRNTSKHAMFMTDENFSDESKNNVLVDAAGMTGGRRLQVEGEKAFEIIYPDYDDLYEIKEKSNPNYKSIDNYWYLFEKLNDFVTKVSATRKCGNVPIKDDEHINKKYKDLISNGDKSKYENNSDFYLTEQQYEFDKLLNPVPGNTDPITGEDVPILDVYKLAAYYTFLMRFGLADNCLRNIQLKTYNGGATWFFEPWDMDIAMGLRNDGRLIFDPCGDRNTQDPVSPGSYMFGGKIDKGTSMNEDDEDDQGSSDTDMSFWIWDALEDNYTFNNILTTLGDKMYAAGLNYNNAITYFDDTYCNYWPEKMFIESQTYKYIEQSSLDNLQGKRETHRHWWLKTSFDYWDARWTTGAYKGSTLTMRFEGDMGNVGNYMHFRAARNTYAGYRNVGTQTDNETGIYIAKGSYYTPQIIDKLAQSDPIGIFQPLYYDEFDLHEVAGVLQSISLGSCVDPVLGSFLKIFNCSAKTYLDNDNTAATEVKSAGYVYNLNNGYRNLKIVGSDSLGTSLSDNDSNSSLRNLLFSKLEELNLEYNGTISDNGWISSIPGLNKIYLVGTNISTLELYKGLNLDVLELPAKISSLVLNECVIKSEDTIKFGKFTINENRGYPECIPQYMYTSNVSELDPQTISKTTIPISLTSLTLTRMGGQTNVHTFIKEWLHMIKDTVEKYSSVNYTDYFLSCTSLSGIRMDWETLEILSKISTQNGLTLAGYIILDQEITTDISSKLINAFNNNIFSPTSSFYITADEQTSLIIPESQEYTIDPNSGELIVYEEYFNWTPVLSIDDVLKRQSQWVRYLRPLFLPIVEGDENQEYLTYSWSRPNAASLVYKEINDDSTSDQYGKFALVAVDKNNTNETVVDISCTLLRTHANPVPQNPASIRLRIKKRTYPTSVALEAYGINTTNFNKKQNSNNTEYVISGRGVYTVYPKFDDNFLNDNDHQGSIVSIEYNSKDNKEIFIDELGNAQSKITLNFIENLNDPSPKFIEGEDGEQKEIYLRTYINDHDIRQLFSAQLYFESISATAENYPISLVIKYGNGDSKTYNMTITTQEIITNLVNAASLPSLVDWIKDNNEKFGLDKKDYYSSLEVSMLYGEIDLSSYMNNKEYDKFMIITGSNSEPISIFNFMPDVEKITLGQHSAKNITTDYIDVLDISSTTKLKVLDASKTNFDIIYNSTNTALTTIKYGTPKNFVSSYNGNTNLNITCENFKDCENFTLDWTKYVGTGKKLFETFLQCVSQSTKNLKFVVKSTQSSENCTEKLNDFTSLKDKKCDSDHSIQANIIVSPGEHKILDPVNAIFGGTYEEGKLHITTNDWFMDFIDENFKQYVLANVTHANSTGILETEFAHTSSNKFDIKPPSNIIHMPELYKAKYIENGNLKNIIDNCQNLVSLILPVLYITQIGQSGQLGSVANMSTTVNFLDLGSITNIYKYNTKGQVKYFITHASSLLIVEEGYNNVIPNFVASNATLFVPNNLIYSYKDKIKSGQKVCPIPDELEGGSQFLWEMWYNENYDPEYFGQYYTSKTSDKPLTDYIDNNEF